MKVTVLGSGSWGTALAMALYDNGHDVTVWSFRKETTEQLRMTRENRYLKGVQLPEDMQFTSDIASVAESELVVFATPSFAIRASKQFIKQCPLFFCNFLYYNSYCNPLQDKS